MACSLQLTAVSVNLGSLNIVSNERNVPSAAGKAAPVCRGRTHITASLKSAHSAPAALQLASHPQLTPRADRLGLCSDLRQKIQQGGKSRSRTTAVRSAMGTKSVSDQDAAHMRRAAELARKGLGHTSPNPMVGCVIVKDGKVVGEGYHPKCGEPHAEVFALRQAGPKAEGATAYVTLEPCNHTGRTPPCSNALVDARVARVVVGAVDPNPLVGGKGLETLRRAGIDVEVGVEEDACKKNCEAFMFRMMKSRPMATLRCSLSLDGNVHGTVNPNAKKAGGYYSQLLAEYDAVVVTDAAVHTNPSLLSAEPGAKQPLRVVLARSLDMPLHHEVFDVARAPTLVVTEAQAIADDVEQSSRTGQPAMESALRERGVEVVACSGEIDLDDVLDMMHERGCCCVLWDAQGPPGSGLEGYLAKRASDEGVVEKVTIELANAGMRDRMQVGVAGRGSGTLSPDFFNRKGPAFELAGGLSQLQRVTTRSVGQDLVIDGYHPQFVKAVYPSVPAELSARD
eukprot:jgi/Mesen1/8840/ME000053S08246